MAGVGATASPIGLSGDSLLVAVRGGTVGIDGTVGITAGRFDIRGLSAGNLYSGTGPNDAVSVVGVSGAWPIGVTANDFDIRALAMGTPADGLPVGYDGVRVAGYSGAFPIGSLLYGASGTTLAKVGVTSGNRLMVDIGNATFSGTVNLSSTVGITGPVDIRGSTLATSPLWIAGGTIAGTLVGVCGGGSGSSVRVEGVTGGIPVGVTFGTVNVRGLTAGDFVGITGEAYAQLSKIVSQVYDSGYASVPSLLAASAALLGAVSGKVSSAAAGSSGVLELLASALKTTNYAATANAVRSEIINSSPVSVGVATITQPSDMTNGSVSATVTKTALSSFTCKSGVQVKANSANTDTVYVGKYSSLTTANGFPLAAGESVFIEVADAATIGVIAASGTQDVRFIAS